jgi:Putative beta-barrel porin 2
MSLRRVIYATIGFVALVVIASPACALDLGEWVPGLKVSPFLSERVDYETNVFQVPSHAQGDVIFKTIPGFVADYTFGAHSLSAGYRAEILRYVDLTSQDTVHHIAAVQLRLDFPRTLVNLRDDVVRTSDPPNTELTGRILSTTNTFKPEAEYRLTPRFSAGLGYAWRYVRFDEKDIGDLIDRDEHIVTGSVFWKFVPRADVGLNFGYGRTVFTTSDRDYTRYQPTISLRGDITPRLSSSLRVGYEWRIPDNSNQESGNSFFAGGDLSYRPTERTSLTLSIDRSIQESTFENTTFYTTSAAQLIAQHQLLPKVTVGARVGGGLNDYSSKQAKVNGNFAFRQDMFFVAGANVEYAIQRWLRVGLEYLRTSRTSNFHEFEFTDDRFTGRVTLQF